MKHLVTSDEFPHLGGNILEGDDATWEPVMWKWLLDTFVINTVLDVGCGSGFSTNWFRNQGKTAVGLDGLQQNIDACGPPHLLCDISQPLVFPLGLPMVDLVWCCEVVEHVEEKYITNLARLLALGRFVAITHAGIGQGGHHHVNCRPSVYWVRELAKVGLKYLPDTTANARKLSPPTNHFAQRGLIFTKGRCL